LDAALLTRELALAGVYFDVKDMSVELRPASARSAFLVVSKDPLAVRDIVIKVIE